MWRVPPLWSTKPKLWLPPAVWCHGDQSTITDGSSAKKASCERIMAWFEHHMRWVLITAFGAPVEPEVNRSLTIVSRETEPCAAPAAPVGVGAHNISNNVVGRPGIGLRVTTTSTSGRTAAPIARA